MKYLSVCSGIEAASVAWHGLGWEPVGFSEIEKFPSQVLATRFPGVKNYGDMTKFREWDIERGTIDLLVGGTPCQAFSVAGLRKGLSDPRGNLALTFVAMVDHYRPEWVVWENVPGVLSSSGGRDFGAFLGALGQLGYGFAYRVLDAQYFGVAQRRRRVFVVAHASGDARRAAEVLFEPSCLRGDPPPRREAGEGVAKCITTGIGKCFDPETDTFHVDAWPAETAPTLNACFGQKMGLEDQHALGGAGLFVPVHFVTSGQSNAAISEDIALKLMASNDQPYISVSGIEPAVYESHPNDSRVTGPVEQCPPVAARWGTGGDNTPLVQQPFRKSRRAQSTDDFETWVVNGVANTVNCFDQGDIRTTHTVAVQQPTTQYGPIAGSLTHRHSSPCADRGQNVVAVQQPVVMHTVSESGDVSSTLRTGGNDHADVYNIVAVQQPTAFAQNQLGEVRTHEDVMGTINTNANASGRNTPMVMVDAAQDPMAFSWQSGGDTRGSMPRPTAQLQRCQIEAVLTPMAVRRLTPVECERLQGFPDGWTDIKPGGKDTPDSPRYKALGNSMAVPVMQWIGERIEAHK